MNARPTRSPAAPRLHLVTDDAVLARAGFVDLAEALLTAGGPALALHLRGPATPGGPLLALAYKLRTIAWAAGALLVVNDRVDVALAAGADGAHLGGRSLPAHDARRLLGPGRRMGVSVHTVAEGAEAVAEGADWIFAGTIWETASHPGRAGQGPGFVAAVARAVAGAAAASAAYETPGGVPILAIGGVTPERVPEALAAGAGGVAVIRGIWDAADPPGALLRYLHAFDEHDGNHGMQP